MALSCPDRPPLTGTEVPDDWPGVVEFSDLGAHVDRIYVNSDDISVVVGIFKPDDGPVRYAASTRPHVVAMGRSEDEALDNWLLELREKWELAKQLRRPFAPAVENDIDAMGKLFGVNTNGTGNA